MIRMYMNKIVNTIPYKIETRYYLKVLIPETINLLGSPKNIITKDKIGENVPNLEITEVVLVHCNIVKNDYQEDSWVLHTFVPNKLFRNLLEIAPTNFMPLKIFNSGFSYIEICFTDQNSQPLEMEDVINLTLAIKWYNYYKNALINWT